MKNLYKSVLSFLMVAAMVFGTQTASATCKSTRGLDFSYSNSGSSCYTYSFEGKSTTSGCIKYSWNIYNGSTLVKSSGDRVFSYTFTANGSYTARLQISDTCNKCDTVIYKTIGVKCSTSCTWYNLKPTIGYANTCRKFTFYSGDLKDTCIKYSWTVDGKAVNSYPGNSRYMIDSFTADGTHSVCVKLTNTCKNCDTTLCVSISAKGCATKCNFGAAKPYFSVWDSCKTLYGYIGPANGCFKYTWTVNGTVVSHDRMFSKYAISANGTYQICVNVKDTCKGCDTTYCGSRSITCFSTKCNFGATKQYFTVWVDSCKYIVGYFQPPSNGCFKYTWMLNGTVVGHLNSYKAAISANGTYKLCLSIKDTCKGCDTTYCGSQTVTCFSTKCSWKGMDFSSSNKCRAYTFEGKSMSNGCLKYQFYIYANNTTITLSPGRIATYTFPATGSYYVKMNVRDTCHNCDTSIYKLYKIDCNPCGLTPDFSWKADCRKVKFVASGGISGATYYWSFGDGSSGTNGDPSHTYVKDGVYKVCLTMVWKDPNTGESCKKQVCKEIKVHCEQPCNLKGDFSFTNKSGTVKFNATSNNGYYYEWSFGDGTAGSGKDPSHTYKKPGTYTVCLKITDKARKCSITICKKVVIEDPCHLKGDFTWSASTSGSNVVKFNASSNGSYYSWDFGDGTTGTGKDPSHTYSKPGTYTVCVTIYGSNTRCKIKICKTVVVPSKCVLPEGWSQSNSPCNTFTFDGYKVKDAAGNIYTNPCHKYSWSFGDGTTATGKTVKHEYKNGTYKVCMHVVDTCKKCETTICKEITVNCATKCNFGANHPYFSVWDSCKTLYGYIGFNSSIAGCYKYTWSVNGNVISHDRYLKNYSIYNNGTYQVCVNVKDTCHGCDTTYCGTRTITCFSAKCNWAAKHPTYNYFSYYGKCLTITAGLNTSAAGCIKQYYSLAGTAAPYDGKSSHTWTVSKAGTYVVCLKLVDTCTKCDTTICREVTVTNCCTSWTGAGFTVTSNANCVYNFYANTLTKSCLKYQYTLSTSSTSSGTVISKNSKGEYAMTANGTYYLCMKVTDTCNNCDTTICKTLTVTCYCDAHAAFVIDSVNSAGIMYLHSTSTGSPVAYFWDFGDSSYSTSSAPGKHAYKTSGTYVVCLTVYGANKCTTTYCYTIKVTKTRGVASTSHVSVNVPVNIYPNPASASFVITTMGNATYQVLDLNGRVITSGNLQSSTSVSSSGWRDGVYVVKVTTADGVGTTRVMIQK